MFAIVKDGVITQIASSVRRLFPNVSFSGGPNADFLRDNNVLDVVNGVRKQEEYYFVTQGDITLVDGVPTQAFTSIAKRLADEDAKDEDGNQLYIQEWDADANDGAGGMVDTSEKQINYGLKTNKTDEVKQTA
ncbi:uncharacterized protein METZ01_LOCUS299669, partial [marine metagenome]